MAADSHEMTKSSTYMKTLGHTHIRQCQVPRQQFNSLIVDTPAPLTRSGRKLRLDVTKLGVFDFKAEGTVYSSLHRFVSEAFTDRDLIKVQASTSTAHSLFVQLPATHSNMEGFTKKTLQVSRGFTYTYYVADGDKSLPPILFQHGWPDHAQMWEGITRSLRASGFPFPMIIPDMLGYDGTSKPSDVSAYAWDLLTKDLVEIIDAEGYDKVISAGHDWGSASAARLYNYYPERVAGMLLMNVPYLGPARDGFDLDAVNNMTEKAYGYPTFAYWHLFTAPDGPELLRNKVDRLFTGICARGNDAMKDLFCVPNKFREYLEGKGEEHEVRDYAKDPKFKQAFIDRMSRDGFEGAQCWYKATTTNLQSQCDAKLPEGREKVDVPVLYIGCKWDAVCRPEGMIDAKMQGWLPDLEETPMLDSSHWSPYEAPEEVARYLRDWLKRKFEHNSGL